MKILVTGGAGFIGSLLVDKLIEKGNNVIVVDNLSTGKKENLDSLTNLIDSVYSLTNLTIENNELTNNENISSLTNSDKNENNKLTNNKNNKIIFYKIDVCDHEKLNEIFENEKPELVFHLAAQVMLRKSIEDPLFDAKNNILGTISVLEACKKNNIKKIIYTSTGGARVGEPEYLPVDEKHPIKPSSPYGISKHSAEHYIEAYSKLYNINYLIFCFGNVYGVRDSPETKRLIPLFIDLILKNETPKIFGDGEQTRDFIYVLDLVEFMINSIDKIGKTKSKLFHLANGKQISVNEVFKIIKEISSFQGEAEKVNAIKGEVRDIVLDISLVKEELGWNPKTEIEKGIKETWEWFKNNRNY